MFGEATTWNDFIRGFIDDAPGALAVFDREMRYLAASKRWREHYALGQRKVEGESHYDLFPGQPDRWREAHRRALSGEALKGIDDEFVRQDGRRLWLNWEVRPWTNADGDIGGAMIFSQDITAYKEAQIALRDSEAFWRSTFDASPTAIVTIDERGKIITFSRAAETTFGYREAEVQGRNVRILMPEPDHSQHDAYIARYRETHEARIIGKPRVVRARRKNGEIFPVSLHVTEFVNGRRIFVGFVVDVSRQVAIEKRLSEAQAQLQHAGRVGAMGEMATTIAHEINQPLTAAASLAGAAALMLARDATKEAKPLIDEAISEIQRASEIIRQMRDLVRKRKTARSLHEINKVVEDAAAIALIGTVNDHIAVEYALDASAGSSNIDRILIQQVLINLIRNSVDALKDAPERRLSISTSQADGMICIKVADTGCGVPNPMKAKIFESFVSNKEDGLGVGLAISKSIIDLHQGEIAVLDNSPSGAVFVVRIPAA